MRSTVVIVISGALALTIGHLGPIDSAPIGAAAPRAETTFVIPARSRVSVSLEHSLPLASVRPGDTVYFRVLSSLQVEHRRAIPAETFIEATVRYASAPARPDRQRELGIRVRRLIYGNGDIGDVFATGEAAPNDSTNRRGIPATLAVARPGDERVLPRGAPFELVIGRAFVVDEHRAVGGALAGDVRLAGSPPHLECFVRGAAATPDVVIPGTPPTPAVGELPGTPGTPDVRIPGTPAQKGTWRPCR